MVVQDRDRLAADLQSSVVQRIFAAGLSLQSVLAMATQAEVRWRAESSVADLDDAIRLLRQAIFGLENRMATEGLRHRILQLCAEVSLVPEITFAGPVDEALVGGRTRMQMLGTLRAALGQLGTLAEPAPCLRRGRGAPQRHRDRDRPGRRRDQTGLECSAAILGRRFPPRPAERP